MEVAAPPAGTRPPGGTGAGGVGGAAADAAPVARKPLLSATVPGGLATERDGAAAQPLNVAAAEAQKLAGLKGDAPPLGPADRAAEPRPAPVEAVAPPDEQGVARAAREYERASEAMPAAPGDRLVSFILTLATYPFVYLLLLRAARGEAGGAAAGGGGAGGAAAAAAGGAALLDGRRRLEDFPEGRAIVDLERRAAAPWCRNNAYLSIFEEAFHKYTRTAAALADTYVTQPTLRALLLNRWLLSAAGVQPAATLEAIAARHAPRAMEVLAARDPGRALVELQSEARGNVEYVKRQLERRYALSRGPTLLERAEVFLDAGRRAARFAFGLLRVWARVLHYASSLLSIVSGALSFTVVPAIALSVLSAAAQIFALSLSSAAEFLEPLIVQALEWGEAGTSQVGAVADIGGTVGPRRLSPSTVEGLSGMLEGQIGAATPIVNRPGARAPCDALFYGRARRRPADIPPPPRQIPLLSTHPLLVKAYDLGLVDARGDVNSRAVSGSAWALLPLQEGKAGVLLCSHVWQGEECKRLGAALQAPGTPNTFLSALLQLPVSPSPPNRRAPRCGG
ncbi:MAG: hypothetical protein J3K34DRAFT_478094 [Monoraphidium minutum]|nr:MAG: hypothetical protein J3K34DRAFT_478094 [Monoraphidium minutum]